MKTGFLGVFLLLFPLLIFAQTANFEEDFNSMDLSGWSGDTNHFTFFEENGNSLLRQSAPEAGTSWLSHPSVNTIGYWEFYISLGFSPSNNNKAEIFLMSDREDVTDAPNGYMLQAGENGSNDVFRLFRVTNGSKDGEILAGTTIISSAGDWRVKISRDGSGNWTLETGEGYSGILSVEANGTDNTYTTTTHFGIVNTYTSTNTGNFTYDFKIDIPPVKVLNVELFSESELDVTFSRAVDFNTVQASDFILSPDVNPQNVSELNSATARLSFSGNLEGGPALLSVSDIDDLAGETSLADTTIQFIIFNEYEAGDVLINEFLKDPPAGSAEYVEIKNNSSKYLNLKNWKIGDNNSATVLSTAGLPLIPESFLVLTADTTALQSFYGDGNYLQVSLPSLNNSGKEQIRLFTDADVIADSLEYDTDWGGNKISLERRSSAVSAVFRENWAESPSADGGTPGSENEVEADDTAPEIQSLIIADAQTLLLAFTERIQKAPAENMVNYTLSQLPEAGVTPPLLPEISAAELIAADTVKLTLDNTLQEYNGSWLLKAEQQTDIFGNVGSDSFEFNYYIIQTAQPEQVVINEFMYDPPAGFSEFIELYNQSDSTFELQHWTYNDNSGNPESLTQESFVLPERHFVILVPDSSIHLLNPEVPLINMGSRFSSLNNAGDDILIRNENGLLMDSLRYTSAWGGDEVSLERRRTDISAVFAGNWGESPSKELATPGAENAVEEDETPPSISSLILTAENSLQIIFSEQIEDAPAENLNNYELSSEDYTANEIPDPVSVAFSAPDTVTLFFSGSLPREIDGSKYQLSVSNQRDIFGNSAGELTSEFLVIDYGESQPGDVVINEFMYDPAPGFSEFIELYNACDSTFNLQNWTYNDNSGMRRIITHSETPFVPGDFVILSPDSSLISLFPEASVIVMGNQFSSLNNAGDEIVIRNEKGLLMDSLRYTSAWGGDEISLERRRTDISAVFAGNWGESPSMELATPGAENAVEEDKTPPFVAQHFLQNDSILVLIFNERLEKTGAEKKENYSITNRNSGSSQAPSQVIFTAPDSVTLHYADKFVSTIGGTIYEVHVTNQTDIFGNKSSSQIISVKRLQVESAQPGDVHINEFMYDPPSGYSEFIELANFTASNFNLKNWTLNDNSGKPNQVTDQDYILTPHIPGEVDGDVFVVLAPDSSLPELFPELPVIVMGNRFPALNNNTDAIAIRNESGEIIDSLSYQSTWGGKEVSLERRTAAFSARYRENWGDSPSAELATPGKINLIEEDLLPPEILSMYFAGNDSILVIFSERIDSVQAVNPLNFTFTPPLVIDKVDYRKDTLIFVAQSQLTDGTTYSLSAENQQDVFGNTANILNISEEYIRFTFATASEVLINEILYKRSSADAPEFVELYNPSENNFNLSGWSLSDQTGTSIIPEGYHIRSGEFIILTDHEMFAAEGESRIYLSGFPSLNDDQDAVVIKNEMGTVIDSLFYTQHWGGNQGGVSIERKDPEAASNDASNWASSTHESGSSAGFQSSVYEKDVTEPEVIFAKLMANQHIFAAFSEFVDLSNAEISIGGENAAIIDFKPQNANELIIHAPLKEPGDKIEVRFMNIRDVVGNVKAEASIEAAQPLTPNAVVINEILYDPLANSDDNLPDQAEYIELYNPQKYAVSLEGFYLHDEPDENNEVRAVYPDFSSYRWIPSGDYVLVYAEDQSAGFSESKIKNYYELENQDERFAIQISRSNLSLASSGDAIYLADSTGMTIDSVFYDESWQNPNLFSTKGIALEKINPAGPGDDESNWSSSTNVTGGTPGYQNSIYQVSGSLPDQTGISFSPNPFSPDDDGFDDNLFINYRLDQSDYLLRVRIFDRFGRLVRELADGTAAGFEGSLMWDGLTDDRRKNRVGIYIVLFEAYNSAQGKHKTFKETVVLARKFR